MTPLELSSSSVTHCILGKSLACLTYPLTTNEFSLKDCFYAANRIKAIPLYLLENGHQYGSFDVQSLFTNVHIK